jgi:hypothetical protein
MFAKHILVIFISVIALVGNKCTSIALAKPIGDKLRMGAPYQIQVVTPKLSPSFVEVLCGT